MGKLRNFFSNRRLNGQPGTRNPFTLIARYFAQIKSFSTHNPVASHYAIDGLLVVGAINLAASNNNIFAQRLGAGDFHLSMLQFLPHTINLLILIPVGLFTDSLRNKGRMLTCGLLASSFFFLLVAGTGFVNTQPLYLFLIFLAMANASITLYNIGWMGFFPEVVDEGRRNIVMTLRTRMSVLASLIMPLASGGILAAIPSEEGKIIAHQVFYVIVSLLLISNVLQMRKVKATDPAPPKKIRLDELKKASSRLLRDKPFLLFAGTALFFHMTWHMDWTLYFIGQANYLLMNEFQLGLTTVSTTAAQLLTIKYWSRRNQRYGVERTLTFGILGLALPPVAIVTAMSLPISIGPTAFLIMNMISMLGFATINLNFFQCLMPVLDAEYRSFFISVYSCLITLSNAVMPLVGVAIYRGLGGNVTALKTTFAIAFALRIVAGGLWWLRIRHNKKSAEDFV